MGNPVFVVTKIFKARGSLGHLAVCVSHYFLGS
jgi:hypothetical protein